MSLPLVGFALIAAGIYGWLGWVMVSRLRRPTCRVCLHRSYCPTRTQCERDPNAEHCYDREELAQPLPFRETEVTQDSATTYAAGGR